MKYTSYIVVCQDICELICFKLGMMLNATQLYSLIPVLMTPVHLGTQGYRVASHSVVKLHEIAQMYMMAEYVREMTH